MYRITLRRQTAIVARERGAVGGATSNKRSAGRRFAADTLAQWPLHGCAWPAGTAPAIAVDSFRRRKVRLA